MSNVRTFLSENKFAGVAKDASYTSLRSDLFFVDIIRHNVDIIKIIFSF